MPTASRMSLATDTAAATSPAPSHRFEVGKTYATRSASDYDCIFSFTILSRTAKTVTVDVHGKTVRRRVSVYDGVEQFRPFGFYSMAAVISATSAGGVE